MPDSGDPVRQTSLLRIVSMISGTWLIFCAGLLVWYWTFAFLSALLFGVHCTAIWVGVAQLIWLLSCTLAGKFGLASNRIEWKRVIYAAAMTGLFCLPWVWHLRLLTERTKNWTGLSSVHDLCLDLQAQLTLTVVALGATLSAAAYSVFVRRTPGRDSSSNQLRSAANTGIVLLCFFWAIIPVICVVAMERMQVPLAPVRYTVVGSAGFAVLAGVAVAVVGRSRYSHWNQLFVAIVLILVSVTGNPLLTRWYFTAEVPQMRFENWTSVVNQINEDSEHTRLPVLVLGNVLEDIDANDCQDPAFQEYLLFPVSGIPVLDRSDRTLLACPTLAPQPFSESTIELLVESGGPESCCVRTTKIERRSSQFY